MVSSTAQDCQPKTQSRRGTCRSFTKNLAFSRRHAVTSPLQSEQLLLPAHQNRGGHFWLSRDSFQCLSGSNHSRIELQILSDPVTSSFQLLHPLFLLAGRPITNHPNPLRPFCLRQKQSLLQKGLEAFPPRAMDTGRQEQVTRPGRFR